MSGEAAVDKGLMVTEDEQMNEENRELEMGSLVEKQITVMKTGEEMVKVVTPSKGKAEEELSLSELGSSPLGGFQSPDSSQSSERDKMCLSIRESESIMI